MPEMDYHMVVTSKTDPSKTHTFDKYIKSSGRWNSANEFDVVLPADEYNVHFLRVITSQATASQSSTCWGGEASRAIDGRSETHYGSNSVTHTCGPSQSNYVEPGWWKVDLGSEGVIAKIEVLNQGDSYGLDKIVGAFVEVLNENQDVVATSATITDVQDKYKFYFEDVAGRFVRIVQPEPKPIHVAEVYVFGPSTPRTIDRAMVMTGWGATGLWISGDEGSDQAVGIQRP
jgi:hypothetical protein